VKIERKNDGDPPNIEGIMNGQSPFSTVNAIEFKMMPIPEKAKYHNFLRTIE
jgi:hypothetical protein